MVDGVAVGHPLRLGRGNCVEARVVSERTHARRCPRRVHERARCRRVGRRGLLRVKTRCEGEDDGEGATDGHSFQQSVDSGRV